MQEWTQPKLHKKNDIDPESANIELQGTDTRSTETSERENKRYESTKKMKLQKHERSARQIANRETQTSNRLMKPPHEQGTEASITGNAEPALREEPAARGEETLPPKERTRT